MRKRKRKRGRKLYALGKVLLFLDPSFGIVLSAVAAEEAFRFLLLTIISRL
jgi:hypothetical protein